MPNLNDTDRVQQSADGTWQVFFSEDLGWFSVSCERDARAIATSAALKEIALAENEDSDGLADEIQELYELLRDYSLPGYGEFRSLAALMRERVKASSDWED